MTFKYDLIHFLDNLRILKIKTHLSLQYNISMPATLINKTQGFTLAAATQSKA